MAQVYSNSYCNIAAAFARDRTYGCFAKRDPTTIKPLNLDLVWGPRPGICLAVPQSYWHKAIFKTPLHQRAWVCQERYLSPRNVYFCDTQLHWECSELCANETFPHGIPFPIPSKFGETGGKPSKSLEPEGHDAYRFGYPPAPELNVFDMWNSIVTRYTRGCLTYPTDKLVAISGLATRLQKLTNSRYLAGLWERHLADQLLWVSYGSESDDNLGVPGTVGDCYIAPIWSWASADGHVSEVCSIRHADYRDILVQLLAAHVDLADGNNPFGQVTGGYLQLRSALAKSKLQLKQSSPSYSVNIHYGGIEICDVAQLDCRREILFTFELTDADSFSYLPVRTSSEEDRTIAHRNRYGIPYIEGLILQSISSKDGLKDKFRRVGWFMMRQSWGAEYFQRACRRQSRKQGLSYADGEEPDAWGPRQVITIV